MKHKLMKHKPIMKHKPASLGEKAMGAAGSISGLASILGSWQVCHAVCLGIISVLGLLGIAVAGMPLFFLTKIAVPLWIVAVGFLALTILIRLKRPCISGNIILFNAGLIVAGTPFKQAQSLSPVFWTVGGIIAAAGIVLFVRDKLKHKRCAHEKTAP